MDLMHFGEIEILLKSTSTETKPANQLQNMTCRLWSRSSGGLSCVFKIKREI